MGSPCLREWSSSLNFLDNFIYNLAQYSTVLHIKQMLHLHCIHLMEYICKVFWTKQRQYATLINMETGSQANIMWPLKHYFDSCSFSLFLPYLTFSNFIQIGKSLNEPKAHVRNILQPFIILMTNQQRPISEKHHLKFKHLCECWIVECFKYAISSQI